MPELRPGRARSQTTPAPRQGLYRMITPIDHIDTLILDEDNHDPSEDHSGPGTPRTSLTFVSGTEKLGLATGMGNGRKIEPVYEEGHENDESRSRDDQTLVSTPTTASKEKPSENEIERRPVSSPSPPPTTWEKPQPNQNLSSRRPRSGSNNTTTTRRQSLTRKITGTLRPSASRQSEKDDDNAGVGPEERRWKDDIVTFDSKTDPANPKNWSFRRRVLVTGLFGLTTMCSTFASSIFSSAAPYYGQEFGLSTETTVLGTSLFILGYVPGPLIWAPLSEEFGRRMSIIGPVFLFACFTVATAVSKDPQTIFITRFFGGLFASAPVTTVGGGLADMWDQKERGTAVVFYSLAVVAGPTLGPIIGSAAAQSYLGWRWTEYLSLILTSLILVLDIIFLPETFAPVILTRKAARLRRKTKRWALHSKHEERERDLVKFLENNLTLPLRMIATEPMVTCITLYNSFTYGILYMLFGAIPVIYQDNRGWNPLVGSLPFIGILIGCFIAAAINIAWSTCVFGPHLERNGGRARPEMRLPTMMLGSVMLPSGFFLAGWTSDPDIHWFPSVVGFTLIGVSFLLIFQSGLNYLIDSYTKLAASTVASNTFLRSLFAVGLPFAVAPMFRNLGIAWACSLLGFIALLMGGFPFVFYIYGPRLRARSTLIENFD